VTVTTSKGVVTCEGIVGDAAELAVKHRFPCDLEVSLPMMDD